MNGLTLQMMVMEDNAESHDEVPEDELEKAHRANDNDHGTIGTDT